MKNDGEVAAASLESPFLVKNTINYVPSGETADSIEESDIFPHGLVNRKTVHFSAAVDNRYQRFLSIK